MDCPNCKAALSPANFTRTEKIMRGKNERCPSCGTILWIPYKGLVFAVPMIAERYYSAMVAREARRMIRARPLPH